MQNTVEPSVGEADEPNSEPAVETVPLPSEQIDRVVRKILTAIQSTAAMIRDDLRAGAEKVLADRDAKIEKNPTDQRANPQT